MEYKKYEFIKVIDVDDIINNLNPNQKVELQKELRKMKLNKLKNINEE